MEKRWVFSPFGKNRKHDHGDPLILSKEKALFAEVKRDWDRCNIQINHETLSKPVSVEQILDIFHRHNLYNQVIISYIGHQANQDAFLDAGKTLLNQLLMNQGFYINWNSSEQSENAHVRNRCYSFHIDNNSSVTFTESIDVIAYAKADSPEEIIEPSSKEVICHIELQSRIFVDPEKVQLVPNHEIIKFEITAYDKQADVIFGDYRSMHQKILDVLQDFFNQLISLTFGKESNHNVGQKSE